VSCQHLFRAGGGDASPASSPVSAPDCDILFTELLNTDETIVGTSGQDLPISHGRILQKVELRSHKQLIVHRALHWMIGSVLFNSRLHCFNSSNVFLLSEPNCRYWVNYKTLGYHLCSIQLFAKNKLPSLWHIFVHLESLSALLCN